MVVVELKILIQLQANFQKKNSKFKSHNFVKFIKPGLGNYVELLFRFAVILIITAMPQHEGKEFFDR